MENINKEWLCQLTGDPFTDTGGYVIRYFQKMEKWKDKPIMELIEYMAGIYVNHWGAGINALFLNSPITQANFNGEQKIFETVKYFHSLMDSSAANEMGYCRISGHYTQLYPGGRDNYMMAGSGAFVNFHHSFDDGIRLSKEVLIRLFFVPFGVRQIGSMIGIITSNIELISQNYVFENCKANLAELGSGLEVGVLKHSISKPSNALFDFASDCIQNISDLYQLEQGDNLIPKDQIIINLFHFTNFAAAADIVLMTLPADVFEFYAFCHGIKIQKQWNQFVRSHYLNAKYSKAIYNPETDNWETSKEDITYNDYKNWRNYVLERLLSGQSITRMFAKWVQRHRFNFIIVSKYLTTIRNMDKKTVEKILFLADYVVSQDADYISRTIKKLDGYKSPHEFRRALCKWNGDNARAGNSPLLKVEEFVNYLFFDGSNWREIRDVLIIAIYEKSHEKKIQLEVELAEEVNHEFESENQ